MVDFFAWAQTGAINLEEIPDFHPGLQERCTLSQPAVCSRQGLLLGSGQMQMLLLWSMTDHCFLPEEPFPFPFLSLQLG